ncbi:MAG TPA: hypothetical protein VHT03_07375 [Rhizomicrobium sp.]|jgi:hypothetical protein|nr:hypothetical protein [Rhizomicrobium sp.]
MHKRSPTFVRARTDKSLKVPNGETTSAMDESRRLMNKHNARFTIAKTLFDELDRKARKRALYKEKPV